MTNKGIPKIIFTSNSDHQSKLVANRHRMATIKCVCGAEILVLPDLKAMRLAIENHLAKHKKANDGSGRLESLEQFLTAQVLALASEISMNATNVDTQPPRYKQNSKFQRP